MKNTGTKSKYQKKIARKNGRAKPQPQWMWWFERGVKPKGTPDAHQA